ncbi:hypothetical protein VOLCADRAFT_73976 [Volvox carteri f. nagariensis]|uniref:Adaptor protein ClpS core domain-containing protein n=1 Tax=Volvox carteri f. nagariensis TaxID=3068 RepID=D8TR78_VOLCA|nr:uncharacterized protein VOLCADRAFT_73976 [Volvox carteri f. nagariensis]EFJ49948.1 hypothetical protein VOLCADRAFT_73976 [Volvox carteri f. nagariensis]|eukprot:XP_002949013.1 hypothetical protein VOLCADRAFT_73976 [Volvox carteri f. nagariensis]
MAASVLRPPPVSVASRAPTAALAVLPGSACLGWRRANFGTSTLLSQTTRTCVQMRAGVPGLLDSPTITSEPQQGTDRAYKRPPIYKVFLHNDNYNKREYVVKVLLKVVEEITVDDAVTVMQEAHETGVALVVACPQENAERYCEGLRLNGLTSTIEPAGR